MHGFHIALSQLLKGTAAESLYVDTRIVREASTFIDEATNISDGTQLDLYIRNTEKSPALNGLFTNKGVTGILEAAYIKQLDMLSPFIGALIDLLLGKSEGRPITTILTDYKDVLNHGCHN